MLVFMVNAQRVPGRVKLQTYLEAGYTQNQIVDEWEKDSNHRVSRSAIGMAISRYGLKSAKPTPRYPDLLPWELAKEHWGSAEARLLRHEARRRSGAALRETDIHWLESWLKALAEPTKKAPNGNVVGYNKVDGFFWTRREPWHTDIIDPPHRAEPREE